MKNNNNKTSKKDIVKMIKTKTKKKMKTSMFLMLLTITLNNIKKQHQPKMQIEKVYI